MHRVASIHMSRQTSHTSERGGGREGEKGIEREREWKGEGRGEGEREGDGEGERVERGGEGEREGGRERRERGVV